MIARKWHGRTSLENADAYLEFLKKRAVPDYSGVAGCLGVYLLRRDDENSAHFETLTFWTSEEAIRAFAGEDVLKAKYYPEDDDFLLEFEPEVRHYEAIEGRRLDTA